jgi:glutathione synthase
MRIVFVVNAAMRRGHGVIVCGVGDLTENERGELSARGCAPESGSGLSVAEQLSGCATSHQVIDDCELCVVRTNPGRDEGRQSQHLAMLRMLERLEERGGRVINRPRGLSRALTKLSLLYLPQELRPLTIVTRDPDEIAEFVRRQPGRSVIKPLEGTRGRDVFVLGTGDYGVNSKQIIESVLRQGYAVVQEFVAGAENGDVRVTVVGGKVLEIDDQCAAVARVPGRDDFRSNLHAGGSAMAASVTSEMLMAVERIAPLLAREGLFHVGVDFVGGRILELNVFSPGGLWPAERLYERDFASAVIEAFEHRL